MYRRQTGIYFLIKIGTVCLCAHLTLYRATALLRPIYPVLAVVGS